MDNKVFSLLFATRALISRALRPKDSYWLAAKQLKPISRKFGFDRGTPIDRYWIESFIESNSAFITGTCLEIGDNRYTKKYGHDVQSSRILDVNASNKHADIIADLRRMPSVKNETFDTIILTHVLGMVDDYDSALRECRRILKKGGTILVTACSFGPLTSGIESNFWRLTPASGRYIFSKHFSDVKVKSYGNVLSGQAFWVGLAQEELSTEELAFNDPNYPCVVGIRATK